MTLKTEQLPKIEFSIFFRFLSVNLTEIDLKSGNSIGLEMPTKTTLINLNFNGDGWVIKIL